MPAELALTNQGTTAKARRTPLNGEVAAEVLP